MTTHSILIRRFRLYEIEQYKTLRMSALADAPDAFFSTLAEAQQRSQAEWLRHFSNGVKSSLDLPLLAEVDGEPVGLAWGKIDADEPQLAELFQMWVAPDWRREGIGAMLVRAVIDWSRENKAKHLELEVTLQNLPAIALYKGLGFTPIGDPHPLRPDSQKMSQAMLLPL